jgi:Flp pilus assembly protein CpaB
MPRNNRPIIIGAAVLGALAIGLTLMMMLGRVGGGGAPAPAPGSGDAAAQTPSTPTTRLVAARDIPPRTVVTPDMVREEETDQDDPAVLNNASELQTGRITTRPILRGEPITGSAMINTIARVVPANFAVPTGLRAVAIWVDPKQTAAGLVDVGDRVDVIASQKLTAVRQPTEAFDQVVVGATEYTAGRTIAQDLEVLAVDRSIEQAAAPTPAPAGAQPAAPGAAPPPPPPPPPPPAAGQTLRARVILAAPPIVAASLVAANEAGNLHVTIRNPNSRERFPIPETRQYPTRFVNIPKRQGGDGGGGGAGSPRGGGASNSGDRVINNPFIGPVTLPSPTTGTGGGGFSAPPPATGVGGVPPAAAGSEVTVIRGTEKTRVIVPPR